MTTPEQATPTKAPRLSAVWLVPLAATLIGLWLLFSYLSEQGPTITLTLKNAEGITAGKTPVKVRNVQVGMVDKVALSDDLSHIRLQVKMRDDTERMLAEDSRFWVVKPRIGREGISGLNTVLSGAYIELLPGSAEETRHHFDVLDKPPVAQTDEDGLFLTLLSDPGSNVDTGDPVLFRNLTIGRVVDSEFDIPRQQFRHRVFVQSPYESLVTNTSRFWSITGIGFQLDAQGFQMQVHSLEAMLGGGIAVGVPDDTIPAGEPIKTDTEFVLYADREAARRGLFNRYLEYVLLVDETVRGLQAGAPVEYRGLRIGTVEQVPWEFEQAGPAMLGRDAIPVLIRLEPQRLARHRAVALSDWREAMARFMDEGLRASLKSSNLLTGALFVDLSFHEDPPAFVASEQYNGMPVFPTAASSFTQIENQIRNLVNTLSELPIKTLFNKLDRNLASSRKMLTNLDSVAQRVDALLANPATQQLPGQLQQSLKQLETALEGITPGGAGYQQLEQTLQNLDRTLRDAQPLLRTLRQKPNALLFEPEPREDLIPRAPADD